MTMNKMLPTNRPWHEEELFHTAESFYSHIFHNIQKARKSILIEAHYFDDKFLGKRVSSKLIKALEKGIEVYIIIDGLSPIGKKNSPLRNLLLQKGAHIRMFNPLPWKFFTLRGLAKLNHRNHKKMILIDKRIAYLGSYNIDTRQLSSGKGSENWHDCGVRVTGPAVKNLTEGFMDTWHYCHLPNRRVNPLKIDPPRKSCIVRLNHHRSWRKVFFNDIIERINNAKDKVWITNPYFVPDKKMINALLNAHNRGVDISILLPQKSDMRLFPLINFIFIKSLINLGVKVYEYKPRILHAKTIIIDNWPMIGSSNLNSRSQKHDWEIDIVLCKQESLYELEERFKSDLKQSSLLKSVKPFKKFGYKTLASPILIGTKYFL